MYRFYWETDYSHSARSQRALFVHFCGRSKAKLVELAASLELPASVQIFTVDVTKVDKVDEIVQKTKVVINTVGPYFKWSKPVVGYVHFVSCFLLALIRDVNM